MSAGEAFNVYFPWVTRAWALGVFGFAIATLVVPTALWAILVTWCYSLPLSAAAVYDTRDS